MVDRKQQLQRDLRQLHAWQGQLDLCEQLMGVIRLVQQHRGVSLAVLAGDSVFDIQVRRLSKRISGALKAIEDSLPVESDQLNKERWQRLELAWFTVNGQWRRDTAIHNFEFHTHLISELLGLMREIQVQLHQPADATSVSLHQLIILNLPQLLEKIAQLRGLATHSAVLGSCSTEFRVRLEYLCKQVPPECQACEDQLNGAPIQQGGPATAQHYALIKRFHEGQVLVAPYVELIQASLLDTAPRDQAADQLFSQGTRIIETYLRAFEAGIRVLQLALPGTLQDWLSQSRY